MIRGDPIPVTVPAPTALPTPALDRQFLLRSRLVLPLSRPPVENGGVLVSGNRIIRVGPWHDLAADARASRIDVGDCVLLPGLINAHCHLDYTDMAGRLPPQKSFSNWIKLILAAKAEWNYSEFAASWLHGAQMLLRSGTTTVGDFEAVPELLPEVWTTTPLRVVSFIEMTGVKSRRDPRATLNDAVTRIRSLPFGRCRAGLAPHAPYSTVPELLRLSAETARQNRWPLSVHVAESAQEFEMFAHGRGEMFDWLRRNERDMSDCDGGSPVQQLERNGILGADLLAVHVNYLARGDADLLSRRHVSVAHCPRSHVYFRHDPFPMRELARANVNVCLASDSLASVYKRRRQNVELNLFDEMRAFATAHADTRPETILHMTTLRAARALGLAGQAGELSPGTLADLIALPFTGDRARAFDAILEHTGKIAASMIDGHWAIAPA